jgi:hypothetical protein
MFLLSAPPDGLIRAEGICDDGRSGQRGKKEHGSMARYALVGNNSIVQSVVAWDGQATWSPPSGLTAVLAPNANVGDTYNASAGTFTPAPPPALTQQQLITAANQTQWSLATGGFTVTFAGGPTVTFDTSDIGMTLIAGKVQRFGQPNPPTTCNWQTGPTTFVSLTAAQVTAAATMIADFVQRTFDALPAITADVVAGSITTQAQIASATWPANTGTA